MKLDLQMDSGYAVTHEIDWSNWTIRNDVMKYEVLLECDKRKEENPDLTMREYLMC